ncbi:SH3 domain-containing protein [Kordia sp.]|uniref:SH3 domain-containing protein n=1 Tax=Kordia sp. TaxID=1965332 RepID=UPI003B5CD147
MKTFTQKTLYFFLFICATQLYAQEIDYIDVYQEFKVDKIYPLFGDNVNLRSAPNTSSKEITRLRIGFDVTIVSKTNVMFESGESKIPWYEVQYKGQKGFIPGKFIAHKKVKTNTHSFYFNKKITKKHGDQLVIRTVVGDEYSNYKESFMQLYGSLVSAHLEDNHDLMNVSKILKIQHHGESCGAENGITYFFLKENNDLVHITHLSVSGDIGFFSSETFTFTTNENNGQPIIIFKKEEGADVDDEGLWTESKTMIRQFEWNGTKLVPEFSKEFYKREKTN